MATVPIGIKGIIVATRDSILAGEYCCSSVAVPLRETSKKALNWRAMTWNLSKPREPRAFTGILFAASLFVCSTSADQKR